jgi:hypothetical protein
MVSYGCCCNHMGTYGSRKKFYNVKKRYKIVHFFVPKIGIVLFMSRSSWEKREKRETEEEKKEVVTKKRVYFLSKW